MPIWVGFFVEFPPFAVVFECVLIHELVVTYDPFLKVCSGIDDGLPRLGSGACVKLAVPCPQGSATFVEAVLDAIYLFAYPFGLALCSCFVSLLCHC